MGYGRSGYRRGYSSRPQTAGRVARVNARPGPCRDCGEEIPAGAGQLYRESGGAWAVVHAHGRAGRMADEPPALPGRVPGIDRQAQRRASRFGILRARRYGAGIRTGQHRGYGRQVRGQQPR